MTLGRVFRKMGLPMWTFLGVGISAIWFSYFAALIEKGLRDWMGLNAESHGFPTYLPPALVFMLPFLVVIAAWLWQKSRYALTRLGFIGAGMIKPKGKKALMLLVSRAESAMFAIEYHFVQMGTLRQVWLIPSNNSEADKFGPDSRDFATEIKKQCADLAGKHDKKLDVDICPQGVSPADAQDTFDYVNRLFRQGGYEPSEVAADFTGGTKPMSVGMIMACLPTERELEYVSFNSQTKQSHGPFLIDYQHSAFDLVG